MEWMVCRFSKVCLLNLVFRPIYGLGTNQLLRPEFFEEVRNLDLLVPLVDLNLRMQRKIYIATMAFGTTIFMLNVLLGFTVMLWTNYQTEFY